MGWRNDRARRRIAPGKGQARRRNAVSDRVYRARAWLADTSRQDRIAVQRETNSIFLRAAVHRPDLPVNENQESEPTKIASAFPLAMDFLKRIEIATKCAPSRATIVRLKPRSQVGLHIDGGAYYLIRQRFHFVLHSPTGSVLRSGAEEAPMRTGELWWFDNRQHHSAFNESEDRRIHYIFDLLPPAYASMAVNPLPPFVFQPAAAAPL